MEVGSTFLYVDGSILIAVPAGEFIMGGDREDNPKQVKYLDDFWIYRAAVTNIQYEGCVAAGKCSPPDLSVNKGYGKAEKNNDPATGVNWDQGEAYCAYVDAWYPTEAQLEKAIRGTEGATYSWGYAAPNCDLLNAANCVNETTDVTTYVPSESPYGALDGSGNVHEWVADWYSKTYYDQSPFENPLGPEFGERKVVRSTGFRSPFFETPVSRRFHAKPGEVRDDLGFRCVPEDPLRFAPYCEWVTTYGFDFELGIPIPNSGSVSCPTIKWVEGKFCVPVNQAQTNVTISAISPATPLSSVNPGSCSDEGGHVYKCTSHTTLHACAECTLNITSHPACPPDFALEGDRCVARIGRPGECLPGYVFDPEKECCSVDTISVGLGVTCAAGTYWFFPPGICAGFPGAGEECDSFTPGFLDCETTYGSLPDSSPLAKALAEEQPQTPIAPISGVLTLSTLGLAGWIFYGGRKRS